MDIAWLYGLLGGLLIGTGGAVLLLGTGRIMGASGIVGGLVDGTGTDRSSMIAFLVGLIGTPALLSLGGWVVRTQATDQLWLLVIAGFCVGIGTRFANGCT